MGSIDEEIERIKKKLIAQFEKDFVSTANYSTKVMKNETKKIYNSMITQFYKYHTKSYIRHWEGSPGTEEGQNLYFGLKITDRHSNRFNSFRVDFDASEMEGGYEHHSKDSVLKYVVNGIRFTTKQGGMTMGWRGSYHSNYLSIENVTLNEAFKAFFGNYEDTITDVFMKRWSSLGW